MSWFKTGAHLIALCIGCLMACFPGRSVEWIETRRDYYADHLGFKLAKAKNWGGEPTPVLTDFARYPKRNDESGHWTESKSGHS